MDDTGSNIGIPLQPSLSDYTPQTTGITSHSVHILTIQIVTIHIFQLADDNLTVTYSMCFNPNKQKMHSISLLQPWRPSTKWLGFFSLKQTTTKQDCYSTHVLSMYLWTYSNIAPGAASGSITRFLTLVNNRLVSWQTDIADDKWTLANFESVIACWEYRFGFLQCIFL